MPEVSALVKLDMIEIRRIVNFLPTPYKYMLLDHRVWEEHTGRSIRTNMSKTTPIETQQMINGFMTLIENGEVSTQVKNHFIEDAVGMMSDMLRQFRYKYPEFEKLENTNFSGINDDVDTWYPTYIDTLPLR